MNCSQARDLILDVLYGEALEMQRSVRFFRHLDQCKECNAEYLELVATRERLAEWTLPEAPARLVSQERLLQGSSSTLRRLISWNSLQRIAAAFLVVVGGISILKSQGLWPDQRLMVDQKEMVQMVQDLVVANQERNGREWAQALMKAVEQIEDDNRANQKILETKLQDLQLWVADVFDETNRRFQLLLEE